jgi:hypothetical protein
MDYREASDNFILSISLEKVEKLHNLPNQNKTNHITMNFT